MEEREETGSDAVAGDTTRNSEPSFEKSESPNPVVTSITGINMNLTAPAMKKRGRPRKYAPDGSLAMPLNPMPISASVPVGNFGTTKKARARLSAVKKHLQRSETESLGETIECSGGVNFTPHILTVVTGEDVTMKVLSFSQRGPQAICILSANGAVSSATLRQPDTFGGTLTYEGRFEILSLSGSFMPIESVGTRSRSGGMSVSLAGPDGRVVGGGVAGLLIAAGPVQVVIGSFVLNNHLELKIKKRDTISTPNPASGSGPSATYSAAPQRPNVASPSRDDNISTSHPNSITDINISPSGL